MIIAFKIKRQRNGYYAVFNFSAGPSAILELRSVVKLNPVVLRHLLITVPENYDPNRYKTEILPIQETADESKKRRRPLTGRTGELSKIPQETPHATSVAGKAEEEQLKTVEKKLEKILENPDIDIR